MRMLGHEQWVGLTSSPPFPPPTKGGCADCNFSIIWETLYKPNPMVVVSGVAFSPRRRDVSPRSGGLCQHTWIYRTKWSSGQGTPTAALFLVEEMVDWSSDQNFTKCVVVGSLSVSCVALQWLEKLSSVMWCAGAQVLNQARQIWM